MLPGNIDDIITQYKGLVYKYCSEDYLVDGLICLQTCIEKFDPSRGTKFSSYLTISLKHLMRGLYNKERKVDEEYKSFMDPIVEHEEIDIDLSTLTILQKFIIEEFYWKDRTATDIAVRLGLTIHDVLGEKCKAESELRKRYSNNC